MEDIFDGLLDKNSPETPEKPYKLGLQKDALKQTIPRKTSPSLASTSNNL